MKYGYGRWPPHLELRKRNTEKSKRTLSEHKTEASVRHCRLVMLKECKRRKNVKRMLKECIFNFMRLSRS